MAVTDFIDFSSVPQSPEMAKTAPHLYNYRRVYRDSGDSPERKPATAETLKAYLAMYDKLGARHVVVKGKDLETTFGYRVTNEDVAAFCKQHGPRYIGFAGVDPHKGMTALRELEYAVKELGLRGLNIQGFENKIDIDDPRMYPLYAKCIELDIPLNLHTSVNFSIDTAMDHGQPKKLDTVMVHFPELRVCASPPGFPWVHELIAVAWRHPNVSIGLVAVRPKVLGIENSGYGGLLQYGNTVLQDRIIFGSSYPALPVDRCLAEIDALPLKDGVKRKWVHDNAARFLGLK
jgi:uncharacterized protein